MVSFLPSAHAYVRTHSTDTGSAVFWYDPRIALVVSRPPQGFDLPTDDLLAVVKGALRAWSAPAISCTALNLALWPEVDDSQVLGRDRRNRILIRTNDWCSFRPKDKPCPELAVALTSLMYYVRPGRPDDAEILEADIEVNAVYFQWAVINSGATGDVALDRRLDLASAITHEVGHLVGLAHNCTLGGETPAGTVDDAGNPVLPCSMAPPELAEATMYPSLDPGQTSLRTLSPDETRAACEIYPSAERRIQAWSGGGGACALATASRSMTDELLGAMAILCPGALLAIGRRRARRR